MVKQRYSKWIGSSVGTNKPHNFFKTNSKTMPVNMFKDKDRDGVMNVFDCQPNNRNKQGFVDAVVGAVGGLFKGTGVKQGWNEGMSKEGNVVSRAYTSGRALQRERRIQRFATSPGEKARASLPGQISSGEAYRNYENMPTAREKTISAIKQKLSTAKSYLPNTPVTRAVMNPRQYQMALRNRIKYDKPTVMERKTSGIIKKTLRSIYPVIPAIATKSTYGAQSKKGKSLPGRPRGSVTYRDDSGNPVGVYEWRRLQTLKRKAFKQQLLQQQEMLKQQRQLQRMPQYEQQQYQQQQQLPQELEGQGITPEYSQYPQEQQVQQVQYQQQPQYQQVQQQMPQIQQKKPIGTVFKSSGGSPYPAVDNRPLAPSRATIQQGYVETVDLMSGRRYMKKLPQPEGWTR